MQTVVFSNPSNAPSTSATNFAVLASGTTWQSSETNAKTPISQAGTISNLMVYADTVLSQGTYDVTFRKNGASQTLTAQLTSSVRQATSTASFTVAAGDELDIQCVPAGTPTSSVLLISWTFDSTTAGKSVMFAYILAGTVATFTGPQLATSTAEANFATVMPTGGTFDDIYLRATAAPGGGTSRTVTLRKAGVDQSLTATLTTALTTVNAASTVSIAQGDVMTIGETLSGTPASATVTIGLSFTPTTDGDAVILGSSIAGVSATADRFVTPSGRADSATDSAVWGIAPVALTIKNLAAYCSVTPGGGKSRVFTLYKGTSSPLSSTALTVSMVSTNPTFDNTNTVSLSAGDLIATLEHPTGSPTSGVIAAGYVLRSGSAPVTATFGGATMMGMVG